MKVVLGDETGLIKVIDVQSRKIKTMGCQSRDFGANILRWAGMSEADKEIAVGHRDGTVKIYESTGLNTSPIDIFPKTSGNSKSMFIGLDILRSLDERKLITLTDAGDVSFHQWNTKKILNTYNIGDGLYRAKFNLDGNVFAAGGKEKDVGIYDLETGKSLWKAKNVRPDFLDMRVPIYIKDVGFMQPWSGSTKLVTCTGHSQVRIYDTKAQRRPVADLENCFHADKHPLTTLDLTSDGNYAVVSDSIGTVVKMDLRMPRAAGIFRGIGGSIRGIACHKTQPIVATGGLDRKLRLHDMNTRSTIASFYVKQRINCVMISDEELSGGVHAIQEVTAIQSEDAPDETWQMLDDNAKSLSMDGKAHTAPVSTADESQKEALPPLLNTCTYNDTGASRSLQLFYECLTCGLEAICVSCAASCHKDHKLKKDEGLDMGYCDCGAGGSCDLMTVDSGESAAGSEVEEIELSEDEDDSEVTSEVSEVDSDVDNIKPNKQNRRNSSDSDDSTQQYRSLKKKRKM